VKPYRAVKKRGEYFNDVQQIVEVMNAQNYKTIAVEEAERVVEAAREMKRRVRLGKKYYAKRKKRGITDKSKRYFEAVKKARAAGLNASEWRQFAV
jgi:hypothetical protein